MKRILGVAIGGLLLTMVTTQGAWAFGVKDVVAMHNDGVDDSLIIQKIVYSGTSFHLDSKEIGALKSAGVSDAVISKMLKTEAREYASPYVARYGGPYYPYYGPYYAPYYYYHGPYYYYPRVSVGLRFGYHGGYHGGYHRGYQGGFRRWR